MKIALVNTLPIPSGNASVNRILSYSKELVTEGNEVTILSSARSCVKTTDIIDGVLYECLGSEGHIKALFSILNKIIKNHYTIVILISNNLLLIYSLFLICKISGVKLLQEKSEFPFVLMKKGFFKQLYAKFYVNTTYKLFDGLIVMTKPLMEYFSTKVKKSCQLFEMPMTVDTDRFIIEKTKSEYGDYIAYCGDMAGNKDGVINLIEAFNLASTKLADVKLLLIGGSSHKNDLDKIQNYVASLNNDRIIFYGRAERIDIPQLLVNAKALALARPSSLQSTGGFPTKLGEYLSTGNPVIITRVGDIPKYLNDKNAFTVDPDDKKAFADAIVSVFSDYDAALRRGEEGQKLAYSVFNAKEQSKRLNNFLKIFYENSIGR